MRLNRSNSSAPSRRPQPPTTGGGRQPRASVLHAAIGCGTRLALFATVIALGGCASLFDRFDKVTYLDMAPRLSYQGFSFDRPHFATWYFRKTEEDYTNVTLRRDPSIPSPTHTFYASVSLGGIDRPPTSHEDFAELARSKGQIAPYETRTVSYEQRLTTKQKQWCIRVDSSFIARGTPVAPDRDVIMILRGYRCLHPAWPTGTLDFFYSERGLPDEIDPRLSEEGEVFLDGVRIDIGPDTPAS